MWTPLINNYCNYLMALGRPDTSIGLRRAQLTHFAARIDKTPAALTYPDILGYFAHQDWMPETRRSYRSGLRGFFTWAVQNGHIADNPIVDLPQVRVPKSSVHSCPDTVYAAALARADPRGQLILRLAAEAGLRRAEIAQVHRNDLRGTVGRYELLVHGKGANERVVPINDGLAGEIANAHSWIFPSERGDHLHPRTIGVMASALLQDATLHQLRHRFATRAYRGSRNLRAVQQLLGHTNLTVTERYIDCDAEERREAMMFAA
jgi:integrase